MFREYEELFERHFMFSESTYKEALILASKEELFQSGKEWLGKTNEDYIEHFNTLSMSLKKKYTSAARRFLPIGMATKIGYSCNIRSLRTVLEQRTHPESEEEIRFVFDKIGQIAQLRWPFLFKDYTPELVDGYLWFKTENVKV